MLTELAFGWLVLCGAVMALGSWAAMAIAYFRETRRLRRQLAVERLERAMR